MNARVVFLAFVFGLLVVFVLSVTDNGRRYELGHADHVPAHRVGFERLPPHHPPGTETVHAASARRAVVATPGLVNGYPCGGPLPPCHVLRRESGGDPRIWNGRCYMPVGSLGQCGVSSASGLWQFLRSTWDMFGGFVNAADAPVAVQNAKAQLVWADGAGCSHWAAC